MSDATRLERIRTTIHAGHAELARAVARRIADVIRARGGRAVLGLATGATPVGVYRELVRLHRERGSHDHRRIRRHRQSALVEQDADEHHPEFIGLDDVQQRIHRLP